MIHLQRTVPNWLEAVARLPKNSAVILVDEVGVAAGIKGTNPNVDVSLRHWYDPMQVPNATWPAALKGARDFFETFIDGTFRGNAKNIDFIQTWNETLANSQTSEEVKVWATQERAMCHVWVNEYRTQAEYAHLRLCIGNSAVGNWIGDDWARMYRDYFPAVIIGYHPYSHWKNNVRSDFDDMLSMLWAHMDFLWRRDLNIAVEWLFTEAGPFESAVTGWRASECLGKSVDRYIGAVREWIGDCQETSAYKQGRLHGFGLFTTGKTAPAWNSFATEQPELNLMADMVNAEWQPGTFIPPPPQPDPPAVPHKVTVNLLPQDTTIDQKIEVVEAVHDDKETILQSADDAARLVVWGKPGSVVKVWQADHWTGDIEQWLTDKGVANVEHWEFSEPITGAPVILDIVDELPKHSTKHYGTRKLTDITTLTIHHTVGWAAGDDMTAIKAIANFHVNGRGWPGIGYHYVIPPSGDIYQTNYDETWSYHVGLPGNGYAVGIALGGDFTNTPPPQRQLDAAHELIVYLRDTLTI